MRIVKFHLSKVYFPSKHWQHYFYQAVHKVLASLAVTL